MIAGLRAAAQGLSFLPLAGVLESDLATRAHIGRVRDPFTGQEYAAVRALPLDWAVLHVHEADVDGNIRIHGAAYEDLLLARAAARVLVTAERLVDRDSFRAAPDRTDLPGFLVAAVVEAPRGAQPCSCATAYDYDREYLLAYLKAAGDDEGFREFVRRHVGAG